MIQINYRDSHPFYEQIKLNIIKLITTGGLAANEKLPSVRELAATLAMNPNTVQRAYRELEAEGYIYKVTGRGTFVTDRMPEDSPRKNKLLQKFDEIVEELIFLAVKKDELIERIRRKGDMKR